MWESNCVQIRRAINQNGQAPALGAPMPAASPAPPFPMRMAERTSYSLGSKFISRSQLGKSIDRLIFRRCLNLVAMSG